MLSAGKKFKFLQKKARKLFPYLVSVNEPLSKHTTFKIGGPASLFFTIPDEKFLKKIVSFLKKHKIKIFIIGNGSNLLFSDSGFKGAVLKLTCEFKKITLMGKNIIKAGAGTFLDKICQFAQKSGLSGMEWAKGIPGTLGGAIYGNAGAFKTSIGNLIKKLTIFDILENKIKKIKGEKIKFSYRKSNLNKNFIILDAELKLKPDNPRNIKKKMDKFFKLRKTKQPLEFPSAGSVFKNLRGFSAGELIEKAGLKGKTIGGAKISEKHANFIINIGGATFSDVAKLIKKTKNSVLKKFNKKLKEEIIVVK